MTTIQKTFVAAIVAAAVSLAVYETRQAAQLRHQIDSLRQPPEPTIPERSPEQIRSENPELATEPPEKIPGELLKLRGEVSRLRAEVQELTAYKAAHPPNPIQLKSDEWMSGMDQLRQYLQKNPGEDIPEIRSANLHDWLHATRNGIKSEEDCRPAAAQLRADAALTFSAQVLICLTRFLDEHDQKFPQSLRELEPYSSPDQGSILTRLYEIVPANTVKGLHSDLLQENSLVIIRKQPIQPNSQMRPAIYPRGQTFTEE